jgi:hypothetical protein
MSGWHRVIPAIGLVLHLAVGGLVAISGLIMPIWAVVGAPSRSTKMHRFLSGGNGTDALWWVVTD